MRVSSQVEKKHHVVCLPCLQKRQNKQNKTYKSSLAKLMIAVTHAIIHLCGALFFLLLSCWSQFYGLCELDFQRQRGKGGHPCMYPRV